MAKTKFPNSLPFNKFDIHLWSLKLQDRYVNEFDTMCHIQDSESLGQSYR